MNDVCSYDFALNCETESSFLKDIESADSQEIRSVYDVAIACNPRKVAVCLSYILGKGNAASHSGSKSHKALLNKITSIQSIIRAIDPDGISFSQRLLIPHLVACPHSKTIDVLQRLQTLRFNEILGSRVWIPKWLTQNEKYQFIAYIFMFIAFRSSLVPFDYVTQSKHTAHPCETKQA